MGAGATSAGLLTIGFVAMMLLDPIAAIQGQAPVFFARLRPPQLTIAAVGLPALFANILLRGA